jgi:hypothetical protein
MKPEIITTGHLFVGIKHVLPAWTVGMIFEVGMVKYAKGGKCEIRRHNKTYWYVIAVLFSDRSELQGQISLTLSNV